MHDINYLTSLKTKLPVEHQLSRSSLKTKIKARKAALKSLKPKIKLIAHTKAMNLKSLKTKIKQSG